MDYVIIAAGQGSRIFLESGEEKPMVSICGVPMIERLIRVLLSVEPGTVHVVTNPAMKETNALLRRLCEEEGLPVIFRPIVSDNSFYSLDEAARGVGGRFVAFTVDSVFKTGDLRSFVERFKTLPAGEVLMGVTEYVDDESPLWYRLNGERTEALECRKGGEGFGGTPVVSTGIYGIDGPTMDYARRGRYPASTSDFQNMLAESNHVTVRPFFFDHAFDVDHISDVERANLFFQGK